jgi:hypothetical protein
MSARDEGSVPTRVDGYGESGSAAEFHPREASAHIPVMQ